jgi:hypothetical protein
VIDTSTAVDACTLNNALNIAQLVVLVALLRWVRAGAGESESPRPRRAYGERSPRNDRK